MRLYRFTDVCICSALVYTEHASLQGARSTALSSSPRMRFLPLKLSPRPSARLASVATLRRFTADVSTMLEPGADPPSKVDWYSSPSTPIT